eukprot:g58438.t1
MLILLQPGPELNSEEFIPGDIPQDLNPQDDEPFYAAYESFAKRYGWTLQQCRNWLATGDRDKAPPEPAPKKSGDDGDDDDIVLSANPLLAN